MSPSSKERNLQNGHLEEKINHCIEVQLELEAVRMIQDTNLEQVQMSELQLSAHVMRSYQKTQIRNRLRIRFQNRVKGFLLATLSETGLLRARPLLASYQEQKRQVLRDSWTEACVVSRTWVLAAATAGKV